MQTHVNIRGNGIKPIDATRKLRSSGGSMSMRSRIRVCFRWRRAGILVPLFLGEALNYMGGLLMYRKRIRESVEKEYDDFVMAR